MAALILGIAAVIVETLALFGLCGESFAKSVQLKRARKTIDKLSLQIAQHREDHTCLPNRVHMDFPPGFFE